MMHLVQVWREKNPKSSQRPFCVTTRLCEYDCDKDEENWLEWIAGADLVDNDAFGNS